MLPIFLLPLLVASQERTPCYARFDYAASEVSGRHYWHCAGAGSSAQLEECGKDEIWDKKSGLCVLGEELANGRLVKRGKESHPGEVLDREAMGEIVNIGTLFDARTSLMANGASLWNQDTIDRLLIFK